MRRSYLENKYLKKKTDQCLRAYKKQKNYCSRLYKKERKKFFNGLHPSFVTDNKLFWKTILARTNILVWKYVDEQIYVKHECTNVNH